MKNSAFHQSFYKKVLLQLREMLQVLKQKDTPATRNQFQEHCHQLSLLGQKAKIPQWVELLETAKVAIANSQNPYLSSGKLIIKEIKEAGELLVSGRTEEIHPSQELQALAPLPSENLVDLETVWDEFEDSWTEKETITPPDPWETQISKETELPESELSEVPEVDEAVDPYRTIPNHSNLANQEILELFEEDNDYEEITGIDQTQVQEVETEEEEDISGLFDEFYTNDTHPGDLEESELEAVVAASDLESEAESPESLISLFESDTEAEPLVESPVAEVIEISTEPICFYEQYTELEELIQQPPVIDNPQIFAELEGLLGMVPKSQARKEQLEIPQPLATVKKSVPVPSRVNKQKNFEQTMRVPVKQLDNLNNMIGELVVKRNRLEEDQERLRQFLDNLLNQVQKLTDVNSKMQYLYERTLLERALMATRSKQNQATAAINYLPQAEQELDTPEGNLNPHEMDSFSQFHPPIQEIIELIVRVKESASDIQFLVDETDQVARSLRQVTTSLQEGLNQSRMVTFSQTADRMPRAVREISLKLKKQADLIIEGREVLVDKMILEHLYNPMTHLVNNAITHGIELPEVRKARGKNAKGEIKIQAFLQGNQTVITVSDDGAGIDVNTVKSKALERGLVSKSQAKIMSNQEVYDLLFHPGFTTKDKADDFSGRGVGLDVVRTGLQPIRGTVSIDSVLGKGTTFTIRLPLTLSICKALPCLSNNAKIAFPIDGVEDTKDYTPKDIQVNEKGQKCVKWEEHLLPFQPLSSLLTYNRQISRSTIYGGQEYDDTISIVILRGAGNLIAIQVDKILPEQEIVIKQIEGPVPKPAGIAGATVLGDGRIMPIGDVIELIEIAQGRRSTETSSNLWKKTYGTIPSAPTRSKTEPIVLIVDDSITVRQLLSLSFNKAGYRVEEARDGQEAWEKLRSGLPCDIVFCDIEMPRMNGLKLLSMMQQDSKLCSVPVALLTSRGAEKHRQVAASLGASGYLTKPYTEKELLDAAQRMIGGEKLIGQRGKSSVPPHLEVRPKTESVVLIIDDSVVVREMLSITFKKSGYRVEQARDGQEAWEKLRSGLPCQIIFCDIEMPRMNGLELLSRLQEDNHFSTIPVAMITSRGAERHRKIAAELGAKAYFTKPYIEEELLDAAKKMIGGEVLLDVSKIGDR